MIVDTKKTMELISKIGDGNVVVSEEAKVLNGFIQMEFAFLDSIAIDPNKKEKIFETCRLASDNVYDDLIKKHGNEKIVFISSMLKARALVGEWVDFLPKDLVSNITEVKK